MFHCENCGKLQPAGQPANFTVTEKRSRKYIVPSRNPKNPPKEFDGWEIVKESKVCPKCYTALTGKQPKHQRQRVVQNRYKARPNTKFGDRLGNKIRRREPRKEKLKPIVEVINPLPIREG